MTTKTRTLLIYAAAGIIVIGAAFAAYKAGPASSPTEQSATTTPQTATTTEQGPSVQEVIDSLDLRKMIDRARVLKNAGDYDGAIAELTKATSVYPNDTVAYNNLADIYMNFKKDYAKAEANYKKIIANNATHIDAYRHLLELYTTTSYKPTNTAAADIVAQALRALPTAYELQLMLARYYRDTGRVAEARAQYQAAINNAKSQNLVAVSADMEAELNALPQ